MKKNNNNSFTIMELTITTVMIGIILIVAPVVMLKRTPKQTMAKRPDNIATCTTKCIYIARDNLLITKDSKEEQKYDYIKNSNSWYTIELIGGGGGGSDNSSGYPGEKKSISLLSLESNKSSSKDADNIYGGILTGYYLMEVGSGGSSNSSGSPTTLCIIPEGNYSKSNVDTVSCSDTDSIIIAQAAGGITSSEKISDNSTHWQLRDDGEENYGDGGKKGKSSGQSGEIIIR